MLSLFLLGYALNTTRICTGNNLPIMSTNVLVPNCCKFVFDYILLLSYYIFQYISQYHWSISFSAYSSHIFHPALSAFLFPRTDNSYREPLLFTRGSCVSSPRSPSTAIYSLPGTGYRLYIFPRTGTSAFISS